ncbi:hypothetical protein UlMin_014001 [Ulmus minor]
MSSAKPPVVGQPLLNAGPPSVQLISPSLVDWKFYRQVLTRKFAVDRSFPYILPPFFVGILLRCVFFLYNSGLTGTLFRKGFTGTKDKVTIGKIKVKEVAKKIAQKSKTILTDIERWQKGVASTDVFGVPIEVTIQREQSIRPIPLMLVKFADYLILLGLNTPQLFKSEGDKKVIQQLVSLYNQAMINILKKLPIVNYMTLEYIIALLLRVIQKSPLNKVGIFFFFFISSYLLQFYHLFWLCGFFFQKKICLVLLRMLGKLLSRCFPWYTYLISMLNNFSTL